MKLRKLKPKTSKTTTSPIDTAFNRGLSQKKEGYSLNCHYWTQRQVTAHVKGYNSI